MTTVVVTPAASRTVQASIVDVQSHEITVVATVVVPTAPTVRVVETAAGPPGPPGSGGAAGELLDVRRVIANATWGTGDELLEFDCTAGVLVGTLPNAVTNANRVVRAVKVDSSVNAAIITTVLGQTISDQGLVELTEEDVAAAFYSDGANWRFMASFGSFEIDDGGQWRFDDFTQSAHLLTLGW